MILNNIYEYELNFKVTRKAFMCMPTLSLESNSGAQAASSKNDHPGRQRDFSAL